MMHNWYGNHLAQWNVHLHFPFGRHLMLVQDLLIDNLDCFVKGHGFNNLNNKWNLRVLHMKTLSNHNHKLWLKTNARWDWIWSCMVSILGMTMCVAIKFNYINRKEELENFGWHWAQASVLKAWPNYSWCWK